VRSVFPLMSFGQLEFREMQVDVHPHAYLGKVQGCSRLALDAQSRLLIGRGRGADVHPGLKS